MKLSGAALLAITAATLSACGTTQQSSPIPTNPPPAAVQTPSLVQELATTTRPATPLNIFSDGTWVVGTDIEPGTYRSSGPVGSATTCFWFRLKDTTGDPSSVIAAGDSQGPITLTIKATDAAVKSEGCLWSKTP